MELVPSGCSADNAAHRTQLRLKYCAIACSMWSSTIYVGFPSSSLLQLPSTGDGDAAKPGGTCQECWTGRRVFGGAIHSGGTFTFILWIIALPNFTPPSWIYWQHCFHLDNDQHFQLKLQGSVWGGSFTSRLTDKELQQLFTFLVLVSALEKSPQQRVRLLRSY